MGTVAAAQCLCSLEALLKETQKLKIPVKAEHYQRIDWIKSEYVEEMILLIGNVAGLFGGTSNKHNE